MEEREIILKSSLLFGLHLFVVLKLARSFPLQHAQERQTGGNVTIIATHGASDALTGDLLNWNYTVNGFTLNSSPATSNALAVRALANKLLRLGRCSRGIRLCLGRKVLNERSFYCTTLDAMKLAPLLMGEDLSDRMYVWCQTALLYHSLDTKAHAVTLTRYPIAWGPNSDEDTLNQVKQSLNSPFYVCLIKLKRPIATCLSLFDKRAFDVKTLNFVDGDIILSRDRVNSFLAQFYLDPGIQFRNDTQEQADHRHREKRKATSDPSRLWPNALVPFSISDAAFDQHEKQVIYGAISQWQDQTCLQFKEKTQSGFNSHIHFIKMLGCASWFGRLPTPQAVFLEDGCMMIGSVAHEIGHALGFSHEHMRPDRDRYVTVVTRNVDAARSEHFLKMQWHETRAHGIPYDYSSLLHFGSSIFSTNGERTLLTSDPEMQRVIGQREGPSFLDIKMANVIYCSDRCGESSLEWPECKNGGYRNPNNCTSCLCPRGLAPPRCEGPAPNAECGDQMLMATDTVKTLTTFGYHSLSGLSRNTFCSWLITATTAGKRIRLEFSGRFEFTDEDDLCVNYAEVRYKDISLPGPRLCGTDSSKKIYMSYGPQILLSVSVKDAETWQGFHVTYREENCGGCSNNIGLTEPLCFRSVQYDCSPNATCLNGSCAHRKNYCLREEGYCCEGSKQNRNQCVRKTSEQQKESSLMPLVTVSTIAETSVRKVGNRISTTGATSPPSTNMSYQTTENLTTVSIAHTKLTSTRKRGTANATTTTPNPKSMTTSKPVNNTATFSSASSQKFTTMVSSNMSDVKGKTTTIGPGFLTARSTRDPILARITSTTSTAKLGILVSRGRATNNKHVTSEPVSTVIPATSVSSTIPTVENHLVKTGLSTFNPVAHSSKSHNITINGATVPSKHVASVAKSSKSHQVAISEVTTTSDNATTTVISSSPNSASTVSGSESTFTQTQTTTSLKPPTISVKQNLVENSEPSGRETSNHVPKAGITTSPKAISMDSTSAQGTTNVSSINLTVPNAANTPSLPNIGNPTTVASTVYYTASISSEISSPLTTPLNFSNTEPLPDITSTAPKISLTSSTPEPLVHDVTQADAPSVSTPGAEVDLHVNSTPKTRETTPEETFGGKFYSATPSTSAAVTAYTAIAPQYITGTLPAETSLPKSSTPDKATTLKRITTTSSSGYRLSSGYALSSGYTSSRRYTSSSGYSLSSGYASSSGYNLHEVTTPATPSKVITTSKEQITRLAEANSVPGHRITSPAESATTTSAKTTANPSRKEGTSSTITATVGDGIVTPIKPTATVEDTPNRLNQGESVYSQGSDFSSSSTTSPMNTSTVSNRNTAILNQSSAIPSQTAATLSQSTTFANDGNTANNSPDRPTDRTALPSGDTVIHPVFQTFLYTTTLPSTSKVHQFEETPDESRSGNSTVPPVTHENAGVWTTWTEWTPCSATCGLCGNRFRQRTCLAKPCSGDPLERETCGSGLCDLEKITWRYPCVKIKPNCTSGLEDDPSLDHEPYCHETSSCTKITILTPQCCSGSPVDGTCSQSDRIRDQAPANNNVGVWTAWTNWTRCSATCGMCGQRYRRRSCLAKPCSGNPLEREACGSGVCDIQKIVWKYPCVKMKPNCTALIEDDPSLQHDAYCHESINCTTTTVLTPQCCIGSAVLGTCSNNENQNV